jgi:hypothetical protein
MISRAGRLAVVLLLAFILAVGGRSSALAQAAPATPMKSAPWGLLDLLGYGVLGGATGIVIAGTAASGESWDSGTGVALVLGGLAGGLWAGVLVGGEIGARAERAITQGRTISPGHRAAVALGVVLTGATLGAIPAGVLVGRGSEEGTPLGSDEQTIGLLTGAGASLALLYVKAKWSQLAGTTVTATPFIREHGQMGLLVRLRP